MKWDGGIGLREVIDPGREISAEYDVKISTKLPAQEFHPEGGMRERTDVIIIVTDSCIVVDREERD